MRNFLFGIMALTFAPSMGNASYLQGCMRALENLAQPDLSLVVLSPKVAQEIVNKKTPPSVWFEETNFEFAPESKEPVAFALKTIEMHLSALASKTMATKLRSQSTQDMLEILRSSRNFGNAIIEQGYPFKGVAKLMAMFSFIVDHIQSYEKSRGLKILFESEVDFTTREEFNLENYSEGKTGLLGIKPRLVFTVKPIDEVDLILSAYAGVFYIEKSPSTDNAYDQFKNGGRSSILKAAHDVGHAQSKITSITTMHPLLADVARAFYHESSSKDRATLQKSFKPRVEKVLNDELELNKNLMVKVLSLEKINLRTAIILTLFQQSHELAHYTSAYPKELHPQAGPERIFERYQSGEFDKKYSVLNLKLDDFKEARQWLLRNLK